jgi:hypothetical protein
MATVRSTIRLALWARLRNPAANRTRLAPEASPSVLRTLALGGRRLLGVMLLLLGILMVSTLLLLPVGLPLALLGTALVVAPDDPFERC